MKHYLVSVYPISGRIAIAIMPVRDREKLKEALEISQSQAEELAAQQEELRAANKELEDRARALRTLDA